jgi:hypothetical protein
VQPGAHPEGDQIVQARGSEVEAQLRREGKGDDGRRGGGPVPAGEGDQYERGSERVHRVAGRVHHLVEARPPSRRFDRGPQRQAAEHQQRDELRGREGE